MPPSVKETNTTRSHTPLTQNKLGGVLLGEVMGSMILWVYGAGEVLGEASCGLLKSGSYQTSEYLKQTPSLRIKGLRSHATSYVMIPLRYMDQTPL